MDVRSMVPETRTGTVRFIGDSFLFVRDEVSRQDVFLHRTEIMDNEQIRTGDRLEFLLIVEQGGKHHGKWRGIDARKISEKEVG